MAELEKIPGTGNEGRVTKKDILNYVANRGAAAPVAAAPAPVAAAPAPAAPVAAAPVAAAPSVNPTGNVEIIEMDRMRKLIADHMVRSKATSPHVTSFTEADVTNIVKWRDKNKSSFEKKYGEKITFTPIFFEAIVKCIRKYPTINCSLDGYNIILKKDINIGMATALPSGNLIVPVIKNAETKNLLGLAKDVNALANAARNNKLKADDTQGGTFTVTNVGTFGSLMGTPIINQPQVAIMALGAIKKRPMVLETKDGDVIAIRHMMYLSLSYDHRIVDGSVGASFLTDVANELEAFDPSRDI
jgi:2-oxoglutarate dehydrogenase E2 component (dihydrolipoamide succinyltransferase)